MIKWDNVRKPDIGEKEIENIGQGEIDECDSYDEKCESYIPHQLENIGVSFVEYHGVLVEVA